MGKYGSLALLLLLMVLLSRIFAVSQQMRLNKDLTKLKKRGPVSSVGLAKSTFGGARIAVFIAEKTGENQSGGGDQEQPKGIFSAEPDDFHLRFSRLVFIRFLHIRH